jgi:hypothetical protein
MSDQINSVREVIGVLGGQTKLAKAFDLSQAYISKWNRRNWFPADTYFAITDMLEERGLSAPDSLWRMRKAK